jgi:Ferredoxin-like domain in Api92-like protein
MPNYCNNNLTIKGDAKSMHEFYEFVGPLEENFSMQNLCPIPIELEQTDSPAKFLANATKEIKLKNGNTEIVQVNQLNQTEQEYLAHMQYLNDKYGFDNWYDWCNANWGCKWDIDDLSIDSQTDEELCVSYETPWCPNYDFIAFLGAKFQNLEFELEYYEPGMCFAGILYVQNQTYNDIEIPIHKIAFAKNEEDEHYTFFDFDNEDDMEESQNFDDYEIVDILGADWEEAISIAEYNYNNENVTNWSAFEEYINTTIE